MNKEFSKLIFELYYEPAFQAAYFYCGDAAISEEAAQEAIYKAIQNIDQLRDPEKIEAWIKKITINNVNSILNKYKKVVSIELIGPIVDSIEKSPEYVVSSKDTISAVNKAIDTLDPVMKQIIHLYYYQEMKVKDISILIQKPEGTVKTLLYRARILIKNHLVKEGYVIGTSEGGLKVE
ncbi:RNA polymerase, sigma-24 subunit, ECF subfamily [Desulforamulus reducens MI-1]|uniref:RNA polymerase, sigma-24 subunit, ECF subfamily n=1 Tax=Desulforamulus reducens (strain ATCC BAA-1160 / DSM 100696 / MI-1) TaxID=349161 RepID=A4J5K0_DESRM|nr:sigma-70 family RNA polymerase sigma factor [Desulforamulus reducens]ABO50353.1 RNA polymerase, sigma-24 subunit, ECF subfamily [Desulforamulus reducens MI-1]